MKTYRLYSAILMVALCFNFVSCSDDDDDNIINPENVTKRLVKIVDTSSGRTHTYDIGYDSEGRVISIYADKGEWFSEDITYSGETAKLKYYNKNEGEGYEATLTFNEQNYITNFNSDNEWIVTGSYSNGNLTKITESYENGKVVYDYKLNFKDGLFIDSEYVNAMTYTNIPNIANVCIDAELFESVFEEFALAGMAGKMYKYLPEKMILDEGGNDTSTYTYNYELDDEGYVKKVKITSTWGKKESSTSTREFVYENIK